MLKTKRYIEKHSFCSELLFKDWESFVDLLYSEGGRISAILWWDHIKISESAKSIGSGGYTDPDDPDYMYAETQEYKDGFELKTLEEVKGYIREVQNSVISRENEYISSELAPSFYLTDDTFSDAARQGEYLTCFESSFPSFLSAKVEKTVKLILRKNRRSKRSQDECLHGYKSWKEYYFLSDGSKVSFPYRMYIEDNDRSYRGISDKEEKLIYDCIYTRNGNGFVREKHIKNILMSDEVPEWCMPFILRLSSEYIVEILQTIDTGLRGGRKTAFLDFCRKNPVMFKRSYSRMVSYWNEYYRADCCRLTDYIGYKLFKETVVLKTNIENISD